MSTLIERYRAHQSKRGSTRCARVDILNALVLNAYEHPLPGVRVEITDERALFDALPQPPRRTRR